MSRIFDTHAHYDDAAFDADREALLRELPRKQVGAVIVAATDVPSARACVALSEQYGYIWAAVGIHPETAQNATDDQLRAIYDMAVSSRRVRAIGEIGLDYHYEDGCPREIQRMWFRRQLALAKELDLPVIVHDRDAHEDVLALLREYRPRGVVHCFSGSVEMMKEVVGLGMYIGLGGAATFKNAKRPVAVAREVPADRLLLETDAPYMAPEPFRGKRCDSSLIAYTAQRIAGIRETGTDTLLDETWENACRLFDVHPEPEG